MSLHALFSQAVETYEKAGNPEPLLAFLPVFKTTLGVTETAQEIGYSRSIGADWYYALGPQKRNKIKDVVRTLFDLERNLGSTFYTHPIPSTLKALQGLVPTMLWLETQVQEQDSEVPHGPFVLVQMPGVSQKAWGGALEALDKATELIRKKFPQLLYGKVFVTPSVKGGKAGTVAMYMPSTDIIYLSLRAQKTVGDVLALVHEFGHRYDYRFWRDKDAKQEFFSLSSDTVYEKIPIDPALKKKLVEEFLVAMRSYRSGKKPVHWSDLLTQFTQESNKDSRRRYILRDLSQKAIKGGTAEEKALRDKFLEIGPNEIVTDKILRGPLAVTPYGATDWKENFCEAFAHFLVGKPLPPEIQSFMEHLK